jgi:8-oxo-dGTP pyrophosphatase MutT (NUDIX family)
MHNVSLLEVKRSQIDPRQTPVRENTLRGVLGIIFNKELDKVLLILKNRPDFAKGKYNGVGGKHEANETDQACASRVNCSPRSA